MSHLRPQSSCDQLDSASRTPFTISMRKATQWSELSICTNLTHKQLVGHLILTSVWDMGSIFIVAACLLCLFDSVLSDSFVHDVEVTTSVSPVGITKSPNTLQTFTWYIFPSSFLVISASCCDPLLSFMYSPLMSSVLCPLFCSLQQCRVNTQTWPPPTPPVSVRAHSFCVELWDIDLWNPSCDLRA